MRSFLKTIGRAAAILMAAAAVFGGTALAGTGPAPTVPEIDPGAAAGALTLLVGGVLTLVDRRRPKSSG